MNLTKRNEFLFNCQIIHNHKVVYDCSLWRKETLTIAYHIHITRGKLIFSFSILSRIFLSEKLAPTIMNSTENKLSNLVSLQHIMWKEIFTEFRLNLINSFAVWCYYKIYSNLYCHSFGNRYNLHRITDICNLQVENK